MVPQSRCLLTRRELEILQHIAEGETDREIAVALGIGNRTVDTHVTHILQKFGVTSRTAATSKAIRDGIIE